MTNFNIWEYLITKTGNIVDVEFYYMLIEDNSGITVRVRDEQAGWEYDLGNYLDAKEGMNAVEEFREKVDKLAEFEEDLNLFQ